MQSYDIIIIGGGVVGCAVLYEMSHRGYNCALLERAEHLITGASAGNSGIVHSGFDASPGTLEYDCLQSSRTYNAEIYDRLGVPYKRIGAVMVAWTEDELRSLPAVVRNAHEPGCRSVRQISKSQLLQMEPQLSRDALGAVFIPDECVTDPWLAPIACAVASSTNGGKVITNCKVYAANLSKGQWTLQTTQGRFAARLVINCAGLSGDLVEELNQPSRFRITPRKGEFVVFSKTARKCVNHIILRVPKDGYKGVLLFPTVYDNVIVGPTNQIVSQRHSPQTDARTCADLLEKAYEIVPALRHHEIVGRYAGLRPATREKDYHIYADAERRWYTVGGIRSPTGLSSCLGIAVLVRDRIERLFPHVAPAKIQNLTKESKPSKPCKPPSKLTMDGDGFVQVKGRKRLVTHPLTFYGLQSNNAPSKL